MFWGKNYLHRPETRLLKLARRDAWTLNDAYMGCLILGGTGSGKTSGSGRALARAYLRAGFGGLVLCAKPGEADLWRRYCRETGRKHSLVVIDGRNGRTFNFLEYELARADAGRSTSNAVAALLKVLDAMRTADGGGGRQEAFWRDSVRVLLSHSIDALYTAHGRVSLPELMQFVGSAPHGAVQLADENWRKDSFCYQTLEKAARHPAKPMDDHDLAAVLHYFRDESFGALDPKTRSNIVATLTSMVTDFLKGDLRRLFGTTTTTVPELSDFGAVIVLDLPVKTWERGGILAQQIFKFAWQRAMERRALRPDTRPCFLWADECQFFLSSYDAEFQSTARSSRICAVALTQSLPALYHAAGGSHPEHTVNAFLTNFQTKVIHACQDHQTMTWAADLIGKGILHRATTSKGRSEGSSTSYSEQRGYGSSASSNSGGMHSSYGSGSHSNRGYGSSEGESRSTNTGTSRQEVMDYLIQPGFFASGLRTGGKANRYTVDGILFQGGRVWRHTGASWLHCMFPQKG